jgi:hypothetical protein
MEHTIVVRALAFAGMLALAGCAQEGSRPSYIGLTDLDGDFGGAADTAPSARPSQSLRYVQSNKVLGAMAYQKVTGRSIDPDSLSRE